MPQLFQLLSLVALAHLTRQGHAHRGEEFLLIERDRQKICCSRLDRTHRVRDVGGRRHEDDCGTVARNLPLQVETVCIRKLDIENQARREIRSRILEVLRGTLERQRAQTMGSQQRVERSPHVRISMDHENDLLCFIHAWRPP